MKMKDRFEDLLSEAGSNFHGEKLDTHEALTPLGESSVVIRKFKTAPSPVISMYCNSKVIHITLDCGAEAPCINPEECKRLGLSIIPPSQLAKGIDKS